MDRPERRRRGPDEFFRVYFPRAVPILGFYRAAGHPADLARAWGGGPAAIAGRLEGWCHAMKHRGGAAALAGLEAPDRAGRDAGALEQYRLVTGYVRRNAYRMDYPAYLKSGRQIGPGSMESACEAAVCQRLCGTGMRWGSDGQMPSVTSGPCPGASPASGRRSGTDASNDRPAACRRKRRSPISAESRELVVYQVG